jgi:nicotinate-nucleotide pyrophosphorylase (carboxylating)
MKDNHLDVLGRDIPKVIESFFPFRKNAAFFEIEVETPAEAKIACATFKKLQKAGLCHAGKSLRCFVMLDNFSPKQIKKTLKILRAANLQSCAKIEASGGINEKNIVAYAKTGVDIISMGSLTHSAPMLDISLESGREERSGRI